MSSPLSQTLADDPAALVAAATMVAEASLFTYLDVLDAAGFSKSAASVPDGWLHVHLTFTGPANGDFGLVLPKALARRLCAAFTGAELGVELPPAAIDDFAGEVANMICGAWLTSACRQYAFDLTKAAVTASPSSALTSSLPRLHTTYVAIDDSPVRVDIAVQV